MVKRKKIVRQKQKQSQNVIINFHNLKNKKKQVPKKIISRPITTYPVFQDAHPPVPIIQLNTPPPVQYYQNPLMPVAIKESIPLTVTSEEEKLVTPSKKPLGKKPRKPLTREEKDINNLRARTKRMMKIVG
jgi:hypothetical protein